MTIRAGDSLRGMIREAQLKQHVQYRAGVNFPQSTGTESQQGGRKAGSEAGKNSKMGANEQGQGWSKVWPKSGRVSGAGKDTGLYFTTVRRQRGALGRQGRVTGFKGHCKDTSGYFRILRGRKVRKPLLQSR